ncbi:MAG: TrkH family potassium uptake protein, partial [Candidatus Marinimicrobia bacterium]|nr:TrkH family potassium uptake protein [Candidatus Neomarinimicrobiota bacterium]
MKINHKIILYFIGFLLLFNGGFMFISSMLSYYYKDGITMDLIYSGLIVTLIGGLLLFLNKNHDKQLNKREGYLVVVLGWLAMIFTGTLPYILTGTIDGFSNIVFETTSGFTTTGATIINDIEILPKGILFWRSITHWLGGMGIIVFAIAILPLLGIGGMQLFSAESPGMEMDKLHPRITDTAKRLWLLYLLFTLVETALLTFAGMSLFDAINHSMSNIASGGFSTKNASLGFWNDQPLIQYIVIFFMFIAGTNFVLSYFGFKGKFKKIFENEEFRIYSLFIALCTVVVGTVIYFNTDFLSNFSDGFTRIEGVFRHALFQVVSIVTTTGFTTADYTAWTPMLLLIFFGLMFVGGSAGSTAGGFKVMRHLLIIKNGLLQFRRILHPNAILPIRYNKKSVSSEIMYNILGFFIVYMLSFMAGTLVFSILGLDFSSSLGVSASSLGNVGPSIGDFGPSSTFHDLPVLAKWWSSFLMLLGRLELYTVLIIITPYFWR